MAALAIAYPDIDLAAQPSAQRKSWVHWLALALVALTIASSGYVSSEPAPVDVLTIGLIVLLPTIGLAAFNPTLLAYLSLWTVAGAATLFAAAMSLGLPETLPHVGITLYLYLASVVFAAFVAKSPAAHTQLIFKAWTWAALGAAAAGLIGYFALLPGTYDLFTKYGRASATFKDPNVFGPFLVVPLLYMIHVALARRWTRMLLPLGIAGVFSLAVLVTFSRGAWMNLALAVAVYAYLTLVTSNRAATRLKILALLGAAIIFAVGLVAVALQSDYISDLLVERASLTQSYDVGTEGRFGGQEKAVGLIVEHPLGIGAQEFTTRHHPEEVHNVYLNLLLNAGWLGGGIYWILVGLTIALGFRHAMKAAETRPLFLIAYSAFFAVALQGVVIDTDHWRHFYLLMAIVWGTMSAPAFANRGHRAPVPAPHRTASLRAAVSPQPRPRRRPSLLAPA